MSTLHNKTNFQFQNKLIHENNTDMYLISLGTRYKYLLVIYGIGLYTSKIPSNISEILNGNFKKSLVLKFYRDVSTEKVLESFKEAFLKRNYTNKSKLNEMHNILNKINAFKYKDEISFIWDTDNIQIYKNKNLLSIINDLEFAKTLFKCYLDENSITEDLRKNINN